MTDPKLCDEKGRLAAVARLEVLNTPTEEPFENIVNLVRTILGVPIATVTLVDRDRQWFKASRGLAVHETPRAISFCTHTIQQRVPLLVPDAHLDPRFADNPLVRGSPHIRSYAGVPLRTPEGYNVGALCAIDTKPRTFSAAEVDILANFANIVSDELELRLIARHDHLTGALTRRGFIEQASRELADHARHDRPCSLVMLDVDRFKAVNDDYGHAAGDQVLRQIAELCGSAMRPHDCFGRLGGEEFALLLPDTDHAAAFAAAERFRKMIEAHTFAIAGDLQLRVTVSLGLAPLGPSITSVDGWLAAADAWLYQAKRNGRNRCCPALHSELADVG